MNDANFSIEYNIIKGVEKPFEKKNKHNIGQILLNSLTNHGNRIAQIKVETGEQQTYDVIKDSSIRCALWLKKQGIGFGDVITLCTYNQLDACIPGLAIFYVGAVYSAWHHEISLITARQNLSFFKPKIIFSCETSANLLIKAAKLENITTKIIVFDKYPCLESLTNIISLQSYEEVQAFKPQEIHNPQETAMLLFTSGTSGAPKAVAHCYDSLLENMFGFFPQTSCVLALWYSGLSWISGTYCTFKFLISGSTAIFHSSFDPEETFQIIDKYKVNWVLLTPRSMTQCCKVNGLNKYQLQSLKTIATGSTPMSVETYEWFKNNYPNVAILHAYGMTELGSLATQHTEECKRIDSVGFIKPNRQLKIINITTGETLKPNEKGEVCIKSPGMMIGYYKNPTATNEIIDKEGWLHSGDIGYYDEGGEIFITDTLKNEIKYRGYHFTASEIEQVLIKHPGVMEVAVVPVLHTIDYEQPMAFVKKVPGSQVTVEELTEIVVNSMLKNYENLWGGVIFIDELPLTTTGKICRSELKKLAKTFKTS